MSKKYLELIEKAFNCDKESLSKDDLKDLMDETFSFVNEMKEKFNDPEKLEEALEEAKELQGALQSKMKIFCEKMGVDPDQVQSLLGKSFEDAALLNKVQSQFHQVQQTPASDINNNKIRP